MLQLTSFTQKISLLLVLSLLSTLVPGPTAISGTRQVVPTGSAAFASPLPTPTPQPQVATFTSPLPTPAVPVPEPVPALGLTVRAEPMGVAPGETVTLTLRLDNSTGTALSGVSVSVTLPDALHRIPDQPGWAYEAREKRLGAEARTLAAGTSITLTLTLRAAGPVDTPVSVTFEAVGGEMRAAATAEVWIVQPGRARVTPEVGGLLVSPDRRAWVRFPAGAVDKFTEVAFEEVSDLPVFLPYSLGRAFAVRGLGRVGTPIRVGARLSRKELPVDSVSWQLAALFRYDEDTGRWQALDTRRSAEEETLTLSAETEGTGVFAVALSTQSETGNYEQPWQPTVRDYQVDLFTGAATWEVSIDTPPGRNGQAPALALRYHSGVVDELRGTQNPQASWVGLGWNLDLGYIARKIDLDPNYVPRCTEEYHLVLNGVSSKLIAIGNNEYRTEDERYWRIRRIPSGAQNRGGDYWLVTMSDGTEYRFGYQDETAGGDSRESAWWMVSAGCDNDPDLDIINWRWNLDQIADPYGNIVRVDYRREPNNFRFTWPANGYYDQYYYSDYNPCSSGSDCWVQESGVWFYRHWMTNSGYVRGGSLEQVTYSWPSATHAISFTTTVRTDYLSAFDSQTAGIQPVQTFWNKERLQVIEVRSNGQGQVVRRYELSAGYDEDGRLRLQGIQEVAVDGTRLPQMTFGYLRLPGYSGNCVQGQSEGGYKPWLGWVSTGYGGSVGFGYTEWPGFQNGQTMGPNEGGKCWYRYRVRRVTVNSGIGPEMHTVYEYRTLEDTAHPGSWQPGTTEFRGHPKVRVLHLDQQGTLLGYTDHWFHQGLGQSTATGICSGDVADANGLQGREYKQVQYDGSGITLAIQTTRWQVVDLGGGRRFVAPVAACAYPNGGSGPYARTDYAYDSYGNVARVVQYGDATRSGDEATVEREYGYNTGRWIVNRVATERLVGGDGATVQESRYAYDGQPWGTAPITGSLTAVMQGLAGWGWVTTTFQYDPWGNRIATTDPLGRVTRTGYDAVYRQYPVSTTNALTQTTRVQWDLRLSVPVVITDANNAPTRYTYDPFGRLTGVTYPGESVPAVCYAYPTGSALSAPWAITSETRVDPYNATPTYQRAWTFYDGLGRAIQTQTAAENGQVVVQDTAYDALGRAVTVTVPYTVVATGGLYITPTWSTRPRAVTRYDALGRVMQVTAPDGVTTTHAYLDWREMVLDANGHQTEYEKDGLGRLVAVREYYGIYSQPTWDAPNPAETRYWYDAAGNLVAARDALGNVTRMHYDPLGRKVAMDDPSMGRWEYRYDAAGNLVKQRDARGQAICFAYDALNRLIGKTYHTGIVNLDGLTCPGGAYAVAYAYDQGVNGIGRRTGMMDATGTTAWQYDARGRVLTETRTLSGIGTFITGWGYDAAGRVVRQVYPDGEVVTTAYNLRGLLVSVGGQNPYLTGATYNAQGQPLQQVWGNGRATT